MMRALRFFILAVLAVPVVVFAAPVSVHNLRLWPAPDNTRLVFDLSGPLEHRLSTLNNPERIVIEKRTRRLLLMNGGEVVAAYPVKLGLSPVGHKQYEGDFRTPEGSYLLSRRNPRSEYFLSLEVSYPNEADRARARAEGLRPGGLIMIHGQPNVRTRPPEYYANNDWTNGCIAVSNSDMIDIWQRTRVGMPIEIRP